LSATDSTKFSFVKLYHTFPLKQREPVYAPYYIFLCNFTLNFFLQKFVFTRIQAVLQKSEFHLLYPIISKSFPFILQKFYQNIQISLL